VAFSAASNVMHDRLSSTCQRSSFLHTTKNARSSVVSELCLDSNIPASKSSSSTMDRTIPRWKSCGRLTSFRPPASSTLPRLRLHRAKASVVLPPETPSSRLPHQQCNRLRAPRHLSQSARSTPVCPRQRSRGLQSRCHQCRNQCRHQSLHLRSRRRLNPRKGISHPHHGGSFR
jgi:hypothetical protein